ncbi:MAG: molybdopterin oxidoreductase family protein [Sulfurifustaceae bacterium]
MLDRIADIWGERTPFSAGDEWPVRRDEFLAEGVAEGDVERWVQSACVLCSNGCALDIAVAEGRIVGVRGRDVDRINRGRLGPKGLYGWQANNSPERLTRPLVRRDGELVETTWDDALDLVVSRSRHLLNETGPSALGFYTTGQLFLEDYYTLGVIVRGGIGTAHLDGNTRLCTATADYALKETFGTDGQPGSYTDFDACDTLFLVGHNVGETQTVLWMRILDRLRGPDRPRLVVVDPRRTPAAHQADVHLAIRNGTNLALLNSIQHELIVNEWVDDVFLAAHTVGFAKLRETVLQYAPERAAEICGVAADDIREAARIIGTSKRLVSTCLQGVYQSHQATASACQVNNVNLLRGMVGKPGCAPFQLNGQPTAQNTREAGADGDPAGMRNWQNVDHIAELAAHWKVDPLDIPSWAPPTHVMNIFRHCEEGSIKFLWIIGTNPAVSLPELHRIRSILKQERLFVVVSDAFMTETSELADVVLPAAMWGEKTGVFTNQDRTVHISDKAVDPPGEAKPDMEILIEYARRLGLKDRNGQPLIKWSTPEQCFDAFKEMTRGRPCDYSGLTYEKLRGCSGIQWPCTTSAPDGTERLYTDHHFNTDTDYTEDWGHDLVTGAAHERKHHAELNPAGRAILKAAHYAEPYEAIRDDYPFLLTTGRTVYHWHTRTKTGRVPELQAAAPEVWVELSASDARALDVQEGDWVRVSSPRGAVEAQARISSIREGVIFIPFHYGYWDNEPGDEPNARARAANELTITAWDPVSKQPIFKTAAVKVERLGDAAGPAPAPHETAPTPVEAR